MKAASDRPWQFRIVKDTCVIEIKKKGLSVSKEVLADNDDIEWWNYFRLKSKEEEALSAKMNSCMKTLEAEQYRCIHYFYQETKSFQEIPVLTGLPVLADRTKANANVADIAIYSGFCIFAVWIRYYWHYY